MAQTTTERKKNRDFYLKETIRYYKISKNYSKTSEAIQLRNSFSAYDSYIYNGGTKKLYEILNKSKEDYVRLVDKI
jgi:hypothetical protein